MTATIEQLGLGWTEPRQVNTVRGMRDLRTAEPTPEFWAAWRADKDALKDAGISVRKDEDSGQWEVCWWQVIINSEKSAPELPGGAGAPQDDPRQLQGQENAVNGGLRASTGAPGEAPEAEVPLFGRRASPATPAMATIAPAEVEWSVEQQAILRWLEKPRKKSKALGVQALVVQALAGTGKTFTSKAAMALAPEASQLYVVFNKKNQREAQEKITDPRAEVRTWHSVGLRFIREVWPECKPDDEVEKDRAMQVLGQDAPAEVVTAVLKLVAYAKNVSVGTPSGLQMADIADAKDIETPNYQAEENGGWTVPRLCGEALKVMELAKTKDAQGRVSFNDMVWLPCAMGWVRARWDLVAIDEAQDSNAPQLAMAHGMVRKGGRIMFVGDSHQAIYGFRGTVQGAMGVIAKDFRAETLPLTVTRRCCKAVVAKACELVPEYKAHQDAPEGQVEVLGEAALLKVQPGDAILSRVNAPLMSLCLALLRQGTPARIEGRDLGKALAALVRRFEAKSVPHFLEKVESWLARGLKRASKSRYAEDKCAALRDQADTLVAVAEGCSSVREVEQRLESLFADSDQGGSPKVVLSSVHKAKGLEWDRVFLLEKTFRHAQPAALPGLKGFRADPTEEGNIRYVAVTRARRYLGLVQGDGSSFQNRGPAIGRN